MNGLKVRLPRGNGLCSSQDLLGHTWSITCLWDVTILQFQGVEVTISSCYTWIQCSHFFNQNIPGYLQVSSRSTLPFSRFLWGQLCHQTVYANSILKLQELKTWKILSQYNTEMLYILTFQVLSMFSAKCLVLSRFSHFWDKFQAISGGGQIKLKSPGFPGSTRNPVNRFHCKNKIHFLKSELHYMYCCDISDILTNQDSKILFSILQCIITVTFQTCQPTEIKNIIFQFCNEISSGVTWSKP